MADFSEVCKINDITDGTMKQVHVQDKDIMLAHVDGKFYAADGRCPHMHAYLSKGTLNGTIVTCPLHGSQFDLKTGKVVRWVRGKGFISLIGKLMSCLGMATKKEKPLTIYEVKIQGDRVMAKIS